LTVDAVAPFVASTRVKAVHFGSGVRVDGKSLAPVDETRVRRVRTLLDARA